MKNLYILDGIGPFFRGFERERINWSKVPFDHLENPDGGLNASVWEQVQADFETLSRRAAAVGYTAITLDDIPHLIQSGLYPDSLNGKIKAYREQYAKLFATAATHGLDVLITTDIMFFNDALDASLRGRDKRIIQFLREGLSEVLDSFPQIRGIIFRIGESDAADAGGDFRSRLVIKSVYQARKYLHALLPLFEERNRLLIFRTWSVGAYGIGDLMWNRDTLRAIFDPFESDALVLSIKYGESDFFRYLPLNKQFFRTRHKKIVELQARREYEGSGEYPAFVGWEYEPFQKELDNRDDIIGCSVWCQTGGWSRFHRLTYLKDSSFWTELNVYVCIQMFRYGASAESAIESFRAKRIPQADPEEWGTFLKLSDEVIRNLLYISDFSQRKIFFRRLRVPPLLWVFWDTILVNHSIRKMLRCSVKNSDVCLEEAARALMSLEQMVAMAETLGVPKEDVEFELDTFRVLAAARRYYLATPYTDSLRREVEILTEEYTRKYPDRAYHVLMDFRPVRMRKRVMKLIMALVFRDRRGYRWIDYVFTIHVLAFIHPFIRRICRGVIPSFAEQQAMGYETLLK